MNVVEQTYLDELGKVLYGLNVDYSTELFDIVVDLITESEVKGWTMVYDKQDLKAYIIGKALQENRKIGSYGWNGCNVLAMLDLIDEHSKED